ncbi:MAG: hypothetical protein JNM56_07215 [Planctomycetia bacterium]|nr:hypothetical protein [Planctomycetia bacterium]
MFWKRKTTGPAPRRASFRPTLETLEAREVPAVIELGAAQAIDATAAVRYKSFANTGSREIYVGKPDLGVGANRSEVDFSWLKPGEYNIAFSYDGATTLTTTVTPAPGTGGSSKNLLYTLAAPLTNLDAFEIILADRHGAGQVNVTNLQVDGVDVGTGTFNGNGQVQSWKFAAHEVADGAFTFTGTIHLSGTFSGGDEKSKLEIKVGDAVGYNLPELPVVTPGADGFTGEGGVRFKSFGNGSTSGDVYVGRPDLGIGGANRTETGGIIWETDLAYSFTITYSQATNTLTATIAGKTVVYTGLTPGSDGWNALRIDVVNRQEGNTVHLDNVEVNGVAVGNFYSGSGGNTDYQSWTVSNLNLNGDFTITGEMTLHGAFSNSSELSRVEIQVGHRS